MVLIALASVFCLPPGKFSATCCTEANGHPPGKEGQESRLNLSYVSQNVACSLFILLVSLLVTEPGSISDGALCKLKPPSRMTTHKRMQKQYTTRALYHTLISDVA